METHTCMHVNKCIDVGWTSGLVKSQPVSKPRLKRHDFLLQPISLEAHQSKHNRMEVWDWLWASLSACAEGEGVPDWLITQCVLVRVDRRGGVPQPRRPRWFLHFKGSTIRVAW